MYRSGRNVQCTEWILRARRQKSPVGPVHVNIASKFSNHTACFCSLVQGNGRCVLVCHCLPRANNCPTALYRDATPQCASREQTRFTAHARGACALTAGSHVLDCAALVLVRRDVGRRHSAYETGVTQQACTRTRTSTQTRVRAHTRTHTCACVLRPRKRPKSLCVVESTQRLFAGGKTERQRQRGCDVFRV